MLQTVVPCLRRTVRTFVDVEQPFGDDAPHARKHPCRRMRCSTPQCWCLLAINALLLSVGFLHMLSPASAVEERFQASRPVTSRTQAAMLVTQLQPMLQEAMEVHKDYLCLTGANIRRYYQAMLIRDNTDDETDPDYQKFHLLFNPVVTAHSPPVVIGEWSLMCVADPDMHTQDQTHKVKRPTEISVEYYDENFQKRTANYTGMAAFCISHSIEVMSGWWPCPHTAHQSVKVPALPVYPTPQP